MNALLPIKAAVGIDARKEFEEKNPGKKSSWLLSRKLIGPALVAVCYVTGKIVGLEFDSEKLTNGMMYVIDHKEEIVGAVGVFAGVYAAFKSFIDDVTNAIKKRKTSG